MAGDGIGLAEALLGLDGFRVLDVVETAVEVIVTVERRLTSRAVGAAGCGLRLRIARRSNLRDLPCFGRPGRLVWIRRRWRCPDADCEARTWTETSEHIDAQVVLTRRAGLEACRQVGEHARPVAQVAREAGVCWWTIMNAVTEFGTPLVDDPEPLPIRLCRTFARVHSIGDVSRGLWSTSVSPLPLGHLGDILPFTRR